LINELASASVLFAGLDDVAFEGLVLGAKGWVSGLTNAFPAESLWLYEALPQRVICSGHARCIARGSLPLLHLDAGPRSGAIHQACRADHGPRFRTRCARARLPLSARAACKGDCDSPPHAIRVRENVLHSRH